MHGIKKKDIILLIAGSVVGGFVSIITALLTGYIQVKEPVLQYIRNDSPPINYQNSNTSIYFASVYNVGNKEAEDVDCTIRIPKGKVLSHGVQPLSIRYDIKQNGDTTTIHFGVLNPNEAVTHFPHISALLSLNYQVFISLDYAVACIVLKGMLH